MADFRMFGSLSPDVEDRRGEKLSPADEARLLMGHNDGSFQGLLPEVPVNPLGVDAGMLSILPSHGRWLLARKMAEQQALAGKKP